MSNLFNNARAIIDKRNSENGGFVEPNPSGWQTRNAQMQLFQVPRSFHENERYRNRPSSQAGAAGENVAMGALLCWGISCSLSTPGAAYDLIADVCGIFLKIQVKSKTSIGENFVFEVSQKNPIRHGPRKIPYSAGSFDLSACVCISLRKVLFFPGVERRIRIKQQQFLREGAEYQSWLTTLSKLNIEEGE